MQAQTMAADAEKSKAALSSVLWSLLLTLLKLGAGLATNSLGILSEALHSALDLIAAGITYFAVRVAAKPADRKHPYGYGKVENLSALIETVLLLLTCIWIVHEAINRLFFHSPEVSPSWWGIGVIAVSIVVDTSRSRMLNRVAKKHKSQALEADALHFSTDILSSCVVLAGLLGLWIASLLPEGPVRDMLKKTDAVAALIVAVIVVWVGLRLCRKAVTVLLDGGGQELGHKFEEALGKALPQLVIRKLRVRESGASVFADLTLTAPEALNFEAAHDMTRMVEAIAEETMPGSDVTVHIEPSHPEPNLFNTVHATAAAFGLSVHSLALYRDEKDGLCAHLHVEAPGDMSLNKAHELVDAFENSLQKNAKAVTVVSHIEPKEADMTCEGTSLSAAEELAENIKTILAESPALPEPHDITVRNCTGGITICFHCNVPGELTVAAAHELSSVMEKRLRLQVKNIERVDIHMEPDNTPATQTSNTGRQENTGKMGLE